MLFVLCLAALMFSGCEQLLGPDPDEISSSSGIYSFDLEHIRFEYDTGSNLMTVTNLTSVNSKVRVTRYDDRADERSGIKFTLRDFNCSYSYHEEYPRGTEIWIDIWRDGIHVDGYVEFR